MSTMYLDFPLTDGSRICVQRHDELLTMPYIQPDHSIPIHAHDYYEMVLIRKNSCRHVYEDDETTLLAGDIFLIPPHRPHAYQFTEEIVYYNCQFYSDVIAAEWMEDIRALSYDRLRDSSDSSAAPELKGLHRQGILHLTPDDAAVTAVFLEKILIEQQNPRPDSERMKRSILHLMLTGINRVREQHVSVSPDVEQWKQRMINETLDRFQEQIYASWDIEKLAREYHISVSYFRSIFRKLTGMPPTQYLNQMRINRAVDMIQHEGLSLSDASSAVGIHDLNYFSRLCKQFTGYTPSHFRKKWS